MNPNSICFDLSPWVRGKHTAVGLCALRLFQELYPKLLSIKYDVEIFSRAGFSTDDLILLKKYLGDVPARAPFFRRYVAKIKGQYFVSFDHRTLSVDGAKKVLFVHDAWTLRDNPWQAKEFSEKQREKILSSLIQADFVFTPTEQAAKEIRSYPRNLGVGVEVLNWAPIIQKATVHEKPGNELLMVATLETRKNHHWSLELLKSLGQNWKLNLVGGLGFGHEQVLHEIESMQKKGFQITHHKQISSENLDKLYVNSFAMLCPSFEEGFGLTLLEALSVGLPVLASDIPAHKEVGSDAVKYFDPNSQTVSISQTLLSLKESIDEWKSLSEKSVQRAKTFSWQKSADQFIQCLEL